MLHRGAGTRIWDTDAQGPSAWPLGCQRRADCLVSTRGPRMQEEINQMREIIVRRSAP